VWGILGAIVLSPLLAILTPLLPTLLSPLVSSLTDRLTTAIAAAIREFEESIIVDVPPLPIDIDRIELDDLTYAGQLTLPERWDPPTPSVRIEGEMEANDATQAGMDMGQIAGVVWEMRTTYSRSHHGRFSAETRNMLFPIDCEWSLEGNDLSGDGTVDIQGVSVRYQVDGRLCQLWLEEGDSLERAELRVNATDRGGNTSSDYKLIDAEGTSSSRIIIGGELLEGPSALGFLYMWREARSLVPDIIEEPPDWSAIAGELSTALKIGTDIDLPATAWAGPLDYKWPDEPPY
jgi:hypothetical protein